MIAVNSTGPARIPNNPRRRFRAVGQFLLPLALGLVGGCSDFRWNMPEFRNPFTAKVDAYESQYTTTPADRIQQLEELTDNPNQIPSEQLAQLAQQLNDTVTNDPDKLVRRAAVRLLAELPDEFAAAGLRQAVQDKDPTVRQLAIEGWSKRNSEEAISVVTEALRGDDHLDVQLAATKGLANFRSPEVIQSLSAALQDRDPAVQYRAAQSLARVTGQNLGTDVTAWQRYLAESAGPAHVAETPQPAMIVR